MVLVSMARGDDEIVDEIPRKRKDEGENFQLNS
jgi:hypothetical protein